MNERASDTAGLRRLTDGRHHAPYELLGRFDYGNRTVIRVFRPDATHVALPGGRAFTRVREDGIFEWRGRAGELNGPYRLEIHRSDGSCRIVDDPYALRITLPVAELKALSAGRHRRQQRLLGAHPTVVDGVAGVRFAVWAPNAERVSVVGDFNDWDGRRQPMQDLGPSGVWSLFVPAITAGAPHTFEVRQRNRVAVVQKADPCAEAFEPRPRTASVVAAPSAHEWQDGEWIARRAKGRPLNQPVSIYEVPAGICGRTSMEKRIVKADLHL